MNDILNRQQYEEAVKLLRLGGVIAFPTETYYGLAADPFNEQALERLFFLKQRERAKPILVLVRDLEMLACLTNTIPAPFLPLIRKFWPGPLTLLFPALATLPGALTGNTGTIGIRCSSNPVASSLLNCFQGPLTATSANRSGMSPARTAKDITQQFGDNIDMLLDGGETPGDGPSTLVGLAAQNRICCLREGVIPWRDIMTALP